MRVAGARVRLREVRRPDFGTRSADSSRYDLISDDRTGRVSASTVGLQVVYACRIDSLVDFWARWRAR